MTINFASLLQIKYTVNRISNYYECQKIVEQNEDIYQVKLNLIYKNLNSMNLFVGTLQTLTTKTMKNSLLIIKPYEEARSFLLIFFFHRIEFDAYRYGYDTVLAKNHTDDYIERLYHHFKERDKKLKADVTVKLSLRDYNRIKVMQ
ncbi:unnamed protein product [Rotaria sordida]|uniref:Uncharacterized protein n=1 Tax=Rotaria sordida TaxID=392033 RepID=A0A818TG01_9BILA|nr:unnamed protein product [Rotaria sordida]CAF1308081.1 unnamed protein product [Rotaria sordida]CAF3682620.1 unnamed protein product [Rotaria sordida]CAF3769915.1 unnamed protein product [Rotaria sordida]